MRGKEKSLLRAERILVMRYRFIGDTILTVPFLRNLRLAYPQAQIDVLVGPQSGSVLEGCPYVDELITFDTTRFHKYDKAEGPATSFLKYAQDLRKRKYDLVFVLKRSLSSGVLSALTGARYRVGYDTQFRRLFLSHPVAWDASMHEVESTLSVLKAVSIPVVNDHLEAWISPQEKQEVLERVPELKSASTPVLIHAAAAHPDKMYPLESWGRVIKLLNQECRILPFYTGADQDALLYHKLDELSGVSGVHLAGKLTLRQSLALYSQMALAICVDSGPAHLAAAAGVPTISLFGPTDPGRWRPWGDRHLAIRDEASQAKSCCQHSGCAHSFCLGKLTPHLVVSFCLPRLQEASRAFCVK